MDWTTPEFEEIRLCCEINSYACASLQCAGG
jgi:coenzyme PQQ precursor peptide PqqA